MDKDKYDVSGIGTIKISEDVVGVIAGVAANEVEGVSGLNTQTNNGVTRVFTGKRNVNKGVKIAITDNNAVIDIMLSVDYGHNIPEVVRNVQKTVKETVETITGINVTEVNIFVSNITVKKMAEQAPGK